MISDIFDNYQSVSIEKTEQESIREHLLSLPSKKGLTVYLLYR